jgi:basic membrane protein A and related proteins
MAMNLWAATAVALMISSAAVTATGAATLQGPPKPAFLYAGPTDDAGLNQSLEAARTKLQKLLHTAIPSVQVEGGADVRAAAEGFIKRGSNIVIGDSAEYTSGFRKLAGEYPKVAFINITGDILGAPAMPNFQSVYGRTYESQYLCGVVAGATSKKSNIGFLAAGPSAIADWEINGYTLGVLKANPKATVHVVFTGDSSATHERTAATALIDGGADVIGQGVHGLTPQLVAQERGVLATGHAVDLHNEAPKSAICSSIWVWDRYLAPEINKIAAGSWEAEPNTQLLGMTGGGTDIACCGTEISRQTMIKLLTERDDVIINRRKIFAGPIVDNQNRQRLPKGDFLSDAELSRIDWYVKGVVIDK